MASFQLFDEQSSPENPVNTTGLCLLSLDGGGVRGLSTLFILKSIMDRLNSLRKESDLLPVKPCEIFDLIGGTSTGGLIAIMLGRLEMDVDECIAAYEKLAESVFGEKSSSRSFNLMGKIKAKYSLLELGKAVKKVIEKYAPVQDLFNDGRQRGCRIFVCTADRYTGNIVRLRSYDLDGEPNIEATICQAALATSAATTFFESTKIGDRSFADGGLGSNNPVDEVEGEAVNIWASATADVKPLVKCFISIGTGNPGIKAYEDNLLGFLSRTMINIATETENTERRFMAPWAKHFDEWRFYRFNVEQGLQDVGLDEHKRRGDIKSATEGYVTHAVQKSRIKNCVENLGLKEKPTEISFESVIKEYIRRNIQHTPDRVAWIVPFQRNPDFVGRKLELSQLEELFEGRRTKKFAVTGLGGVGKTQVALEFIHRIRDKHSDCSIIWIPATNLTRLKQAYLDIARELGIEGHDDKKKDKLKLVQEHLSRPGFGKWLLVYDNADDIDMWTTKHYSCRLIDYLPKSEQGCAMFTSRCRKSAVELAQQHIVPVMEMDPATAAHLLANASGDPGLLHDESDTSTLLKELTYLPLAIVQAAAFIRANGIELKTYISLMSEQEEEVIELLSEDFEDDRRYPDVKNAVATTWLISFEQIRLRDPLAARYLSFMACIDSRSIPVCSLPPATSSLEQVKAIGTLTAYSFISQGFEDPGIDLHRLMYLSMRSWLRKGKKLTATTQDAIIRLEELLPEGGDEGLTAMYLPHASCVLKSNLVNNGFPSRLSLQWKYGLRLMEIYRFREAGGVIAEIPEVRKRDLGPDHAQTVRAMKKLFETYAYRRKWTDAEVLLKQIIGLHKKINGANHAKTLVEMNTLAKIWRQQGRVVEAESLNVFLLTTCKRSLGPDHPTTLASMYNLALTMEKLGRLQDARELHEQIMELHMTSSKVEVCNTMTSIENVIKMYEKLGWASRAASLRTSQREMCEAGLREMLGIESAVLGTMIVINDLSQTYDNFGLPEDLHFPIE